MRGFTWIEQARFSRLLIYYFPISYSCCGCIDVAMKTKILALLASANERSRNIVAERVTFFCGIAFTSFPMNNPFSNPLVLDCRVAHSRGAISNESYRFRA